MVKEQYNPKDLYVIVNSVSAECHGVYESEYHAKDDCDVMNTLGTYAVMTLQEHLDSLLTWFNKFDADFL